MNKILTSIFLFCLPISLCAQNFTTQWNQFDQAKSDIAKKDKILDEILQKAKPETSPVDWLEAHKQKLVLQLRYQEIDLDSVFLSWEANILKQKSPLKNLMAATLAEIYQQYPASYTSVSDSAIQKPTEWNKAQFTKRILALSQMSCENIESLQNIPSQDYIRLFPKINDLAKKTHPYLSDLLIQRHIEILLASKNKYGTDYTGYTNADFTDDRQFLVGKKFTMVELPQNRFEVIYWFQMLSKRHANNPFILSWLDLYRYQVMYSLDYDALKLKTFQEEYLKIFAIQPFSAEMTALAVQNNMNYVESVKRCKEKISQFPEEYTASCRTYVQNTTSPKFEVQMNESQVFNKAHPVSFKIKNIKQVFYKIYPLQEANLKANSYLGTKEIRSGNLVFPDYSDYHDHTIASTISTLDKGSWVILFSYKQNFDIENNILAMKVIHVYPYVLLRKDGSYGGELPDSVCVVDMSGKPVANEPIEIEKDGQKQKMTTDKTGMVAIPKVAWEGYGTVNLIVRSPKQSFLTYVLDRYMWEKEVKNPISAHILTDRAIYRPGQKIYFKAIVRKENNFNSFEVYPSAEIVFRLRSNNGDVSTMRLKTNDFGSADSFFVAPSGLSGEYFIVANFASKDISQVYFRIEEYKRPQFKAEIKAPQTAIKLGDNVQCVGNASFYSGVPVQQAQVKLTITRKISSWYFYYTNTKTLVDTTVVTDEKGQFPIQFLAEPVRESRKGLYYTFTVQASVTDMSGETQTANYQLYLSDTRFKLSAYTAKQWIHTEDHTLQLTASSTAGVKVPAKINLKAYRLQAKGFNLNPFPSFGYAEKYIGDPAVLAKEYPYFDLTFGKSQKYDTLWTNLNMSFSFDGDSVLILDPNHFKEPGTYEFIIYDSENQVTLTQAVQVYQKNNTKPERYKMLELFQENKVYKVGDVALWGISSDTTVWAWVEWTQNNTVIYSEWHQLNKETRWFQSKITEQMIGDFDIQVFSYFENQWFSKSLHISVPIEKKLNLEWVTWRDQTEPGAHEKWKLKITHLSKPVQAEVLSVMYDKSLDAFTNHYWSVWPYRSYYTDKYWDKAAPLNTNYTYIIARLKQEYFNNKNYFTSIRFFNPSLSFYNYLNRGEDYADYAAGDYATGGAEDEENSPKEMPVNLSVNDGARAERATLREQDERKNKDQDKVKEQEQDKEGVKDEGAPALRKNLTELAYFAPNLRTDAQGEVWLEFTMPEALTEWKMMNLTHTKDFKIGQNQAVTVTSKELMVLPFTPRFFRTTDTVYFSANVFNKTAKETQVEAFLQFYNPLDNHIVELNTPNKTLTLAAEGQSTLAWKIIIPKEYTALGYKIWVKSATHTDGQESIIPVLTNQIWVCESQPITVNPNKTAKIEISNVLSSTSTTLRPHVASLEITPNPAWFAVMALPYLAEFPHECSEQMFARYYANSLALNVIEKNPEIESVFNSWKNDTTESRLIRNEELKSILKNETPWVLELDGERARKKQMAYVFDKAKLHTELQNTLKTLMDRQMSNGGWPWFPGGETSFYITQHILTGFGKLKKAGIDISPLKSQLSNGQNYLIESIDEWIKKYPKDWYSDYYSLNTLYCLSFYPDFNRKWKTDMIEKLAVENPEELGLWRSATAVVILKRYGKLKDAEKFIKYLTMSAIQDELKGMYYKSNVYGYSWWEDPIETQVRVIEAMEEMGEKTSANRLRVWLLGNKRKSDWGTTKNTTEAVSVLLHDEKLLSHNDIPSIIWGEKKVNTENFPDLKQEVGTGQFVLHEKGKKLTTAYAKVEVKNTGKTQMWGGLHFSYFEDMDKVKSSGSSALKIRKEMYRKIGKDWVAIQPNTVLEKGDAVMIRLIMETDQSMDYIHITDYRATAFEPGQSLSQYQWKNGLGYYFSPKDVATHFFLDRLPAGKNIIEYELKTVHSGQFSNGNVMIESMYAPEFKAQSSGGRVSVK